MTWNFPLFTSIFVLNVVLSLWLAFTVWHYGKVPGVRVFAVMLLASAFWSFGHMLEIGVEQAWAKILWSKTQYLGAVIIGPAWFIFTLHYRGKIKQVRFRYVALMSVIPIITVGLVWTNELHNLIWSSITPSPNNPSILNYQHGVWFWVAIAYNHTLVLSGTWNIFQVLRAAPLEKRSQSKALLIGAVIPTMGNIFYVFGISPVQGADITPFLLTITGIIYLVTVLRFRLFDIRRVARREIIDKMRDGMLVVD